MLDLGEFWMLDVNNFPSAVYHSHVQTPPPSDDAYFMNIGIGVRLAKMFGCACLKHKSVVFSYYGYSIQNPMYRKI